MRKVILKSESPVEIFIDDIDRDEPIFAKQHGKFAGMLIKENDRWILRTGGEFGATGYHDTIRDCIESCLEYNFEFFVN